MAKKYSDALWAEAKKKCRLNLETIKIAKEMGLNPRSLIKNIPDKNQHWKAPVKLWIEEMYEKRKEKALKKALRTEKRKHSGGVTQPPGQEKKKQSGEVIQSPDKKKKKQSGKEKIHLGRIVIPEAFLNIKPNEKKLEKEINFYKKHKKFQKPLVVKQKDMLLLESYTRYIAAKKLKVEEVWVKFK